MDLFGCPIFHVIHLKSRCHSDHSLVLMEANPGRPTSLTRPFKFQEFWLSDSSFPSVVSRAWSRGGRLANRIDNFSKDASIWNKNHFGNVHLKKKELWPEFMEFRKLWPPILAPI